MMSNVAVIATVMESEAGWGRKVDGYLLATDLEAFIKERKRIEKDPNPEIYWTVERETKTCELTLEGVRKLEKHKGVLWIDRIDLPEFVRKGSVS